MKTVLGFSVKIEHISYMIMIACFCLISGIALIIYEINFNKVYVKKLIKFRAHQNFWNPIYFRILRIYNLSFLFKRPKTMLILSFRKNLSIFVRDYKIIKKNNFLNQLMTKRTRRWLGNGFVNEILTATL